MISRIYSSEFYYGLIRKKQGVIKARPLEKEISGSSQILINGLCMLSFFF